MIDPDIINAFFPTVGCFFVALNIKQLYNDKSVKGIYWVSPLFFYTGQGWSVYFFYTLGKWYSFVAGGLLYCFCMTWFFLMLYYKFRK